MTLLLDLRCLSQPKTGIQIVAGHYLQELLDGCAPARLLVLAGEEWPRDPRLAEASIIRSGIGPYDFRRQGKVAALINGSGADVVLSPTYFMPFGVRKPYIITVHDLIPRKVWLGAPSLYVHAFLGARMRRARAVWTVSEYSRREILLHYPELQGRLHVVPSGYVSPAEADPGAKEERSLLLLASRFRHKNIPFALRVFEKLQTLSGRAWRLHIAGHFSPPERLPPGVSLHGRVSDAELTALYRRCGGLLLPSVEEGFSLPLLEGMSHGCLVFYHRHTAMQETAGAGALCLDLGSPEAWADAILALAGNPEQAAQQRTQALRRAAEFTRERFATALREALAGSLPGGPLGAPAVTLATP